MTGEILSREESLVLEAIDELTEGEIARETAYAVMAAPHTNPLDVWGAIEIGRLVESLAEIDEQIRAKTKKPDAKLLGVRDLVSLRLRVWLREYGLTPKSRAEIIQRASGV